MTNGIDISIVYQVQGNLQDKTGEHVYYRAVDRAVAEAKMAELQRKHEAGLFHIVKTVAE